MMSSTRVIRSAGNVLVDRQLPGVHDAHIHPRLHRVIEEGRMHRFADDVVAPKRKGEITHPATDLDARTGSLDLPRRVEVVGGVLVVFLDTGGNGEHVGVEDDVLRVESGDLSQQAIRASTDINLSLDGVGLTGFIEGHHDDPGAVTANEPCLVEKVGLAFLQADGVDDALALNAFETRFDDRPFRAVDHDRHSGHLGLGRDEIQESRHRSLGIEHRLVHVDVDDVRAPTNLFNSYLGCICVRVRLDEAGKLAGPRHIRSLANHDEIAVRTDRQGLETAELGVSAIRLRQATRRKRQPPPG